MGFKAEVKNYNLTGINRQIKAAENDLAGAQWALDNAKKTVEAQTRNLEQCQECYDRAKNKVEALYREKMMQEESN